MDHNFFNNDFEEFLKQKADQYKMYPADRVWNNIYSSLHGRRKWMILFFTLLFIASSLYIGRQAVLSNYSYMVTEINNVPETSFSSIRQPVPSNVSLQHFVPAASQQGSAGEASISSVRDISGNELALENKDVAGSKIVSNVPVKHSAGITGIAENEIAVIKSNPVSPVITGSVQNVSTDDINLKQETPVPIDAVVPEKAVVQNEKPVTANASPKPTAIQAAKASKLFLQLYASPVTTYRRLYNESRLNAAGPVSSSYGDNINKYVHHKPALGFEVGGRLQYKLSNSLSVYAGAQLNYSRYYVDAYKFKVEKASIALNDSRFDTLSGYTDIRNFSGYSPEQLQNQYWQASVPLGVEITLLGNKRLQLGVAGGIQPTFVFHSSSYLISSDYKNYMQSPDMTRSFNVHTNFEAFISYKAGGLKWQLGPQFRSQLLSSYSNQYKVREYLTEFGIKLGITKSLK